MAAPIPYFPFVDAIFEFYTLKIVADQNFTLNGALLFLDLKSGRGLIPYFFPFADVIFVFYDPHLVTNQNLSLNGALIFSGLKK